MTQLLFLSKRLAVNLLTYANENIFISHARTAGLTTICAPFSNIKNVWNTVGSLTVMTCQWTDWLMKNWMVLRNEGNLSRRETPSSS